MRRTQVHGCVFGSIRALVMDGFVFLLGTFTSLIWYSKCPDLPSISCLQMSYFAVCFLEICCIAPVSIQLALSWDFISQVLTCNRISVLDFSTFTLEFRAEGALCSPVQHHNETLYWYCFAQTSAEEHQRK